MRPPLALAPSTRQRRRRRAEKEGQRLSFTPLSWPPLSLCSGQLCVGLIADLPSPSTPLAPSVQLSHFFPPGEGRLSSPFVEPSPLTAPSSPPPSSPPAMLSLSRPSPALPPYTSAPHLTRPHLDPLVLRSEDCTAPSSSAPLSPSFSSSPFSPPPSSLLSSSALLHPSASSSAPGPPSLLPTAPLRSSTPSSSSVSSMAVEYVRELSLLSGAEWSVLGLDVASLHRHFLLLLRLPAEAPRRSLLHLSSALAGATAPRRSFLDLVQSEVGRVSAFASARSRDCSLRLDGWMDTAEQWSQSMQPLDCLAQLSMALALSIGGQQAEEADVPHAPAPSSHASSLVSLWQCVDSLRRFAVLSSMAQWQLLAGYVDSARPRPADVITAVAHLSRRGIGDADHLDHLVQRLTALLERLIPLSALVPALQRSREGDNSGLTCSSCGRRVDDDAVRLSCAHSTCFRCLLALVQQCGGTCRSCDDRPLRMSEVRIDSLGDSLLRRLRMWENSGQTPAGSASTSLPAPPALLRDCASAPSALPSTFSTPTATQQPVDAEEVPCRTTRKGRKARTAVTGAAEQPRSLQRAAAATVDAKGCRKRKSTDAAVAPSLTVVHSAAAAAELATSLPSTPLPCFAQHDGRTHSSPLHSCTARQSKLVHAQATSLAVKAEVAISSHPSGVVAVLGPARGSSTVDSAVARSISGHPQSLSHSHLPLLPSSCHQCKTTKAWAELRYCSAKSEHPTGRFRRCRKKYCVACILRSYDTSLVEYGAQWTCPSCRQLCVCAACQRRPQQKMAMDRAKLQRAIAGEPEETASWIPLHFDSMAAQLCTSSSSPALYCSSPHSSDSSQSSADGCLAAQLRTSPPSSSSSPTHSSIATPQHSFIGQVEGSAPSGGVADNSGLSSLMTPLHSYWTATASTGDSTCSQPFDSPSTSWRAVSARAAEELAWGAIRGGERASSDDGSSGGSTMVHMTSGGSIVEYRTGDPSPATCEVSPLSSHSELTLMRLQVPAHPLAPWPQTEQQDGGAHRQQRDAESRHRRSASDELHLAMTTMRRGLVEDNHHHQQLQGADLWLSSSLTDRVQGTHSEVDARGDTAFDARQVRPLTAPHHSTFHLPYSPPPARYAASTASSCPPYNRTQFHGFRHEAE